VQNVQGVLVADKLYQIELVSNIGTFLLYGMTCVICVIAFSSDAARNLFTTFILPILGAVLNVAMLIGVAYFAFAGGNAGAAVAAAGGTGFAQNDLFIAGAFSLAWLVIGFALLYIRKVTRGVPILHGLKAPLVHRELVLTVDHIPLTYATTERGML
jgi:APA family basic amino acid/polyamine antiporter